MKIICEVSARHVHLNATDVEFLFGTGNRLTSFRELSQPGQFLCNERVDIVTEKGCFRNVAIIGPERMASQVEISRTDCFVLGLKNIPIRESGRIDGTPGIVLRTGGKELRLDRGVIVAKRHIHVDPKTAKQYDLKNSEERVVRFEGERAGTLNVVVRVADNYLPAVHIDTDEANAMGFSSGEVQLETRV